MAHTVGVNRQLLSTFCCLPNVLVTLKGGWGFKSRSDTQQGRLFAHGPGFNKGMYSVEHIMQKWPESVVLEDS